MYYDGQDIFLKDGVSLTSGSLKIGVKGDTTTSYFNLHDYLDALNDQYGTTHTAVNVGDDNVDLIDNYNSTAVDGISTDSSLLKGFSLLGDDGLDTSTYPGDVQSLNFSKEALTPMMLEEGDDQWTNLVWWVMNVLKQAEEDGITARGPNAVRPGDYVEKGPDFRISNPGFDADNWAYNAISAVGNFGEIWEKNLNKPSLKMTGTPWVRTPYNTLYFDGGVQYTAPIGKLALHPSRR
jgi:general L-amino acid transport system substrate-binding protein